MLLSVTLDFYLCCLNSGLLTHYHRSTDSFSCISLFISYSFVVLNFTWSRLFFFFGSDHYPILLSQVHPYHLPSGSFRWNLIVRIGLGFPRPPKFLHLSRPLYP